MERIAIISDIHANITALEAVVKDIEKRNIKRIICLGDIIGKGASPAKCIDIIREKCEVVLQGNWEEEVGWYEAENNEDERERVNWNRDKIGEDRFNYIKNLPLIHEMYVSGSLVRMFHLSPKSANSKERIMYKDKPIKKLEYFKASGDTSTKEADIVIYADIHIQYMEKFYNKTLINTGSIGFNVDLIRDDENDSSYLETTKAHYCILEGEIGETEYKSEFSIQFVRVVYDIEKEIEIINNKGVEKDEKYKYRLLEGRVGEKKIKKNLCED
ncbi:MAG: hypothetical protein A2Y22_03880 [Clostridiales bacterium GWD2_32_59]|nr:MAG: hypothetical protein A2Y22_03880 [Clostridiales bacterium GWD2_32_59]